jgi:MraZ protein
MLIGEYIYIIDPKKRIAIPAKMRKILGKKVVITTGLDNCLVIYPLKEWQKLTKKLENLPNGQVDARGLARIMLSGAVDVELDKLGRILIPDYLKNYAFLKKNVAILGLSNRIEVWDERRWREYKEKTEKEIGDMASRLQQLGF